MRVGHKILDQVPSSSCLGDCHGILKSFHQRVLQSIHGGFFFAFGSPQLMTNFFGQGSKVSDFSLFISIHNNVNSQSFISVGGLIPGQGSPNAVFVLD